MGKLCTDQKEGLVSKLAALFSGVSADEIDKVVDATKTRLTSETKETNRKRLDAFDQQVKTLLDKDYAEAAGMEGGQFLEYVNPLRDKFEIDDLIVITERIVSISKQMSMVKLNGKTGCTYLFDLGLLRQADGVETSNVPYLIRDVENGAAMRNTSPDNCVKQFKKQGRFGLVAEEGIAVVREKPETLNDHYINLPSSRRGGGHVAGLWLSEGRPELDWRWVNVSDAKWGSASCGSRIRA